MDDIRDIIRALCRDMTNRDRALLRYAVAFKQWQKQMRELSKEVYYTDRAFGELAKALKQVDTTQ